MKKVILAIAAVVALAACSNEETLVESPREAIGFGNMFVENSTRATDGSYSSTNLPESFKVYGTVTGNTTPANTLNIFNGVDVYKTPQADDNIGDTGTWWYDKNFAQYWVPGASYNFAAVVGATVEDADKDEYDMPTKLTAVADTNMHFQDMLYNEVVVTGVDKNYKTPVAFNFEHLLSKVKFTATSNATGSYKHTISNIKVANYTDGAYTISFDENGKLNGTWDATEGDVAFGGIEELTAAGVTCAYEKLLIPISDSFNVSFTVNTYNGTELLTSEDFGPITIDKDLVAGNAYNFQINCELGLPITFTFGALGDWGDDTSISIP